MTREGKSMSEILPVKIDNMSCIAGNRYILKNINWEIHKGDHWLLFGMNGCGKTTLLSIVAGFKSHDLGNVEVFGEDFNKTNILQLRKRIGWISASFFDKVYHPEKVLDIVLSGLNGTLGRSFGISNQDIAAAKELLQELHVGHKIESSFDQLSKGERQNVLIARALISEPELLILDEPGTGLDIFAREYMLQTVIDLAKDRDTTIVYVTHYPEEILPLFDQCALMKDGAFYQIGKTVDIFTEENISGFIQNKVKIQSQQGHFYVSMDVESALGKWVRK